VDTYSATGRARNCTGCRRGSSFGRGPVRRCSATRSRLRPVGLRPVGSMADGSSVELHVYGGPRLPRRGSVFRAGVDLGVIVRAHLARLGSSAVRLKRPLWLVESLGGSGREPADSVALLVRAPRWRTKWGQTMWSPCGIPRKSHDSNDREKVKRNKGRRRSKAGRAGGSVAEAEQVRPRCRQPGNCSALPVGATPWRWVLAGPNIEPRSSPNWVLVAEVNPSHSTGVDRWLRGVIAKLGEVHCCVFGDRSAFTLADRARTAAVS